jgi:hypothetical protein
MSFARHGSYFECGASEFEILSTIHRTKLLNQSTTGEATNLPVIPNYGGLQKIN